MTGTVLRIRGKAFFRASCWLYWQLLLLYPDDLYMRYGEEMHWVFREELKRAARRGLKECTAVWCSVVRDTALKVAPLVILRLAIVSTAVVGTLAVMLPVLFAIPTHFPKVDAPCVPKVYASSSVQPSHRSGAFNGVVCDAEIRAEMQGALSVHARNPLCRQPPCTGHLRQLARNNYAATRHTASHGSTSH